MKLTSGFVEKALGLGSSGTDVEFPVLVTDSRKISPGCLFVALKGEKFDAHDFIAGAVGKGARGVLCRRGTVKPAGGEVRWFEVDDTETAFRRLAAAWRREYRGPVVAVAGSVGKTTTKELLSAILRGKFGEVLKTEGSQNGFVGIPMTLLELRDRHGAAVIEIGIDDIGAMEQHMKIVEAGVAVLTAIGPEHLEKLIDVPTVAREEAIALQHVARAGGTVVVNLDDEWIRPLAGAVGGARKVCYSLDGAPALGGVSDGDVVRGKVSGDGSALQVNGSGLSALSLKMPLLGAHNARNLLGAVAVARALGLSAAEIEKGLLTFGGAYGRSELRELPGGTPAICDYYNANPSSVEAGLDLLAQVSARGGAARKRWACLADMLELGTGEEKFHRDLAGKLVSQGVENVLLYGQRMKWLLDELPKRGFKGNVRHFASHADLASAMADGVRAGDAILIKGSRSMKMEEAWKLFEPRFRGAA